MINRAVNILKNRSFFLFGARSTGKTTLIKESFSSYRTKYIDLLNPDTFERFQLNPSSLSEMLEIEQEKLDWVIIDEIQKVPILLDIVHSYISSSNLKFGLTGSSARKLKRGSANLLAGRASVYKLFPLTFIELDENLSTQNMLEWGTLPEIFSLNTFEEKFDFLKSYTDTYLKEEILQEQIIRKLTPFRRFLNVASQTNGQIINFSKIAREVGISTVTAQSYYEVLEETLVGKLLEPYHTSIRKRQNKNPKFYFFDTGIQRALSRNLNVELNPQTYAFGNSFETFIFNQMNAINEYYRKDYGFSYLRTKDNLEIDLILERPGMKTALVEIKSSSNINHDSISGISKIVKDFPNSEAFCLSRDKISKSIKNVSCFHWKEGIKELMSI